jgi:hypothetical protein
MDNVSFGGTDEHLPISAVVTDSHNDTVKHPIAGKFEVDAALAMRRFGFALGRLAENEWTASDTGNDYVVVRCLSQANKKSQSDYGSRR